MNQTVLFRILFLLFAGYSFLSAEILKPTIGGEEKEILKIAGKRRMYTIMREDSLVYQVNGPELPENEGCILSCERIL